MIVIDTNVLAYLWLPGGRTREAQAVRDLDPDWHVPSLWRSEMRSILVGYLRRGALDDQAVQAVMAAMEEALSGAEHVVDSAAVFDAARRSRCSAYDCEFVALAELLNVPLVTEDRQILEAFPGLATRITEFAAR